MAIYSSFVCTLDARVCLGIELSIQFYVDYKSQRIQYKHITHKLRQSEATGVIYLGDDGHCM